MPEITLSVALSQPPSSVKLHTGADALQGLVNEAIARARAEGFAAGQASGSGALDDLVERISQDHDRAMDGLASTAISLAGEIASRVVRLEIEDGRYDLERIVRESLGSSGIGRGKVTVHLHPTDAASLADVTFRSGTTIQENPEVERGNVHVETPVGLLVRNVEHILTAIVGRIQSESGA